MRVKANVLLNAVHKRRCIFKKSRDPGFKSNKSNQLEACNLKPAQLGESRTASQAGTHPIEAPAQAAQSDALNSQAPLVDRGYIRVGSDSSHSQITPVAPVNGVCF